MLSILTTLLLSAPQAHAADHEVAAQWSMMGATDDRFDLIHDRDRISTFGLRGGVAVHDRVSILAGWHRGAWGSDVELYGEGDDGDWEYRTFGAAYRGNRFTLGPKVDVQAVDYFTPYATVQGVLMVGRLLVDEDPEEEDDLNQLAATGLQPGGLAAIGFDIVPYRAGRLGVGFHVEGGYVLTAVGAYKADAPTNENSQIELTRWGYGGFYTNAGVGLYF